MTRRRITEDLNINIITKGISDYCYVS